MTLCIHFYPFGVKLAFSLVVDNFQTFYVSNSFANLASLASRNPTIFAQAAMSKLSDPVPYISGTTGKVVNVHSLVISMEEGVVSGYFWDTACNGCEDTAACQSVQTEWFQSPTEGIRSATNSYCVNSCSSSATDTACDLKIFVTWVGTDVKSKYLESANYRISNFKRQNIEQVFSSMKGLQPTTTPPTTVMSAAAKAMLK